MYLTMIGAETCGMSLSGRIFASCTAERNRPAGTTDPQTGMRMGADPCRIVHRSRDNCAGCLSGHVRADNRRWTCEDANNKGAAATPKSEINLT
jgi:hypothetical protein